MLSRKKNNRKKLIDWKKLPFYLPRNLINVLKKAVSEKAHRYSNTSEFLAQLSKVRITLPNWIQSSNGYELRDWKNLNYLINKEEGKFILKKKGISVKGYRKDTKFTGNSYLEIYNELKQKVGLP